MGLDAFVMCTCLAERRCREPPFPFDELFLDDDHFLHVRGDDPDHARERALYRWKYDACAHEDMEQASEHVGNWSSYRAFQAALGAGPAEYPVLLAELPANNGGATAAARSARCLQELERFRQSTNQVEVTVLVDAADGVLVQKGVAAYQGVFLMSGHEDLRFGVDGGRFFVQSRDGTTRFSARRVRQEVSDAAALARNARDVDVRLVDEDTGNAFSCHTAVGRYTDDPAAPDTPATRYPTHLRAETRLESSDAHDYVLRALELVFRASVETGNPVVWC
jgi:hypothetical protein